MMKKVPRSFYEEAAQSFKDQTSETLTSHSLNLAQAIRKLRLKKKISGADLCRKAGNLDPRTLTAVEKGRIRNPSIQTLQAIAAGLGTAVSDLFRTAEMELPTHFFVGTQKGAYTVEFHRQGIKLVSFTPSTKDLFCGKLIFESRRKIEGNLLGHFFPIFISVSVGRFEVTVENRKAVLKEGENLFFNGAFHHSLENLSQRDGVLLLLTAPSFF
ncbi:MAG: XRE family transcriptional regulator [Candidatus Omnitrophica bacterium]|nr:XRE family transcriptional regulator [Candidatus Omnitrophota bacterium]